MLEPEEGRFEFGLFDETIARLGAAGISTIFCTPTASPPRWLTWKHPEILRLDASGVPMRHGSRQHASYAHPVFREHCRRITRALATHYASNPHVIAWQTDNEIYCHFADDHGPEMQPAFREFLRRAYGGNIGALNRAWGNAFWAQTVRSFEDIETPCDKRPTYANPSALLDYARFLSDVVETFQHEQVVVLRAANPSWRIFHNGIMRRTDYRGPFCQDLDFLGFDIYPFFVQDPATRAASQAFNCDRARSFAGHFLVPEHQGNYGGQADYLHNTPEPGEMRLLALGSIARGADGLLFFRWRTCRFGAEMYWGGVLDHDNIPRRRYEELARLGGELRTAGPAILGTSVFCDVAVATGDYDVREAHATYPMGLPSEQSMAEGSHRAFLEAGYAVGCVHPEDDLSALKLYVIPHWAVFDPAWVPALERWVREGGTLVIGARTGSRTLDNHVVPVPLPGCLRGLAGAAVEEYSRENPGTAREKSIRLGKKTIPTRHWSEWYQPDRGTRVVATWKGRHYTGKPAITLRPFGRGRVVCVGTYLDHEFTRALLPELVRWSGIGKLWPGAPAGVEVVRRDGPEHRLWFFLNRAEKPLVLKSAPRGVDAFSGSRVSGAPVRLPVHGALLVRVPRITGQAPGRSPVKRRGRKP